jgi:hypothetical protein
MFKLCVILSVLASVAAFAPARSAMRSSAMKMSAEGMVGQLAPVGFFDPLGLSTDKTPSELKKYREAELKHGRVAMVAFLGILTGESVNPFFDGKITGPAIYQFQQADDLYSFFWEFVLFGIGLVEGQNILNGWESLAETKDRGSFAAGLREDYVNGDLGFDPLGLKPDDQEEFDVLRTKELQNGRLAMLGVAGIIAQELVNGKGVVENLLG